MPSSGCAALAEVRKDDGSKCPDLSHRIGVERMTPGQPSLDETKRCSREPLRERIRAFVIFDAENDRDLYDRILSESRRPNSDFDVMGALSVRATGMPLASGHATRSARQTR